MKNHPTLISLDKFVQKHKYVVLFVVSPVFPLGKIYLCNHPDIDPQWLEYKDAIGSVTDNKWSWDGNGHFNYAYIIEAFYDKVKWEKKRTEYYQDLDL